MVKRIPASPERHEELREDLRRNVPGHVRLGLRESRRWLQRGDGRAEYLCKAGVASWIVHAEKGDGGLTEHERQTLESCPHAKLVTIPGHVFFLPNEAAEPIAATVLEAVNHSESPVQAG